MNSWQQFFDHYATRYDDEVFTKNTDKEVEFLIEHLNVARGSTILDLGCGTGRHSVPLAAAGFRMTSVDISDGMLTIARQRAESAGVDVEWIRANAIEFVRDNAFDAAICLCEGALCLISDADDPLTHDRILLENLRRSLKPAGKLIVNVLSAARILRAIDDEKVQSGVFDLATMTEVSDVVSLAPDLPLAGRMRERYYTAPEVRRVAADAGLHVDGVYGGTAGNWGLRPIELDDYELMLIAHA